MLCSYLPSPRSCCYNQPLQTEMEGRDFPADIEWCPYNCVARACNVLEVKGMVRSEVDSLVKEYKDVDRRMVQFIVSSQTQGCLVTNPVLLSGINIAYLFSPRVCHTCGTFHIKPQLSGRTKKPSLMIQFREM